MSFFCKTAHHVNISINATSSALFIRGEVSRAGSASYLIINDFLPSPSKESSQWTQSLQLGAADCHFGYLQKFVPLFVCIWDKVYAPGTTLSKTLWNTYSSRCRLPTDAFAAHSRMNEKSSIGIQDLWRLFRQNRLLVQYSPKIQYSTWIQNYSTTLGAENITRVALGPGKNTCTHRGGWISALLRFWAHEAWSSPLCCRTAMVHDWMRSNVHLIWKTFLPLNFRFESKADYLAKFHDRRL